MNKAEFEVGDFKSCVKKNIIIAGKERLGPPAWKTLDSSNWYQYNQNYYVQLLNLNKCNENVIKLILIWNIPFKIKM